MMEIAYFLGNVGRVWHYNIMIGSNSNLQERIEQEQRIAKANQAIVRFLQLSLQLFFQWGFSSFIFLKPVQSFILYQKEEEHFLVSRYHSHDLRQSEETNDYYTRIVQPLCLIWTLYNLLLLIAIKCIEEMSKFSFILTALVNYVVAIFIVVIGFVEKQSHADAGKEIYHRYAPFQVMNCLIVVSLFYFTNALQPRRFSTSPGNFVWVWLFVAWQWQQDISGYMTSIGIIYAIITTTSILMLGLELMKGLTTSIKKIIIIQWAFSLVLTGITQIFALVSHNMIIKIAKAEVGERIQDHIAISLLEIFVIVNILDMLFWIVGRFMM